MLIPLFEKDGFIICFEAHEEDISRSVDGVNLNTDKSRTMNGSAPKCLRGKTVKNLATITWGLVATKQPRTFTPQRATSLTW